MKTLNEQKKTLSSKEKTTVKTFVHHRYGRPEEVVELEERDMPLVGDDQVLVRVHASSVNPADWHGISGTPYLVRLMNGLTKPKRPEIGLDIAGTIEAVGKDVTGFRPGDEVFGEAAGSFAEYVANSGRGLVKKPANVGIEEAGSVGVAGLTALQGLRDHGQIRSGQKVLINGASGGVGTYAVQIAKALGAEVTAVCGTRNTEMVRSLGADRVVDYTTEDFTDLKGEFDLFFDAVGNRSLAGSFRVLKPHGRYVMVSGPKHRVLGPVRRLIAAKLASAFVSKRVKTFVASADAEDMGVLADLLESGRVRPIVDRRYGLEELPEALAYLGEGHASGKVTVLIDRKAGNGSSG